MTLALFARSKRVIECSEMCKKNGWILPKLEQIYCWDMDNDLFKFCDRHLIFKVPRGQ